MQGAGTLVLGTLLVSVFSAVSVHSSPLSSLPTASAPRVFLSFKELKSTGTIHHFAFLLNSTDYRILRMDEDHDRMYVGSKDYILSLDLNDINKEPLIIHWPVAPQRRTECVLSGKDINGECGNFIRLIEPWNRTHLYVCGTGAYNPICTYVDRGQRAQGMLQDQMPRAGGRTSRAADPSASPEPYAPKNDDGGHCCLVNKWSTFLKARLICSVTGSDGIETHFDELLWSNTVSTTSLFVSTHGFLSFCISRSVFKGSAVCVYSMADVRMVFNGPFAHKEGPNYQWVAYQGKIPYPRPGTCPGGTFTPNMKSTKDYPDEVINFMRNHPTMFNAVYPVHKRPLVVRTNVDYEFTTITVDQVAAADGNYEVLFLGTDRGTIQKVIVLPRDDLQTEELVLEEVEVFRVPTPITTMKISPKRQQLYVSSVMGVTHLALHRCDVYGEACADCCLARDPYCAWDGKSCSRYSANQKRRSRRQDVKYGNPIRQCRGYNSNANKNTLETVQYGVEGSTAFLECQARSPHVSIKWHFQKENSDRRREIRSDGRVVRTEQGLLLRSLQLSDGGVFQCTSTEKNFKHTLVKLQLVVLSARTVNTIQTESTAPAVPPFQSSTWTPSAEQYKDLLTILSQPEMGLINQYCQDYWQMGDEPAAHAHKKDLKEVQKDLRKPRNRRHHKEQSSMAET
ncbi:semaphorin-3F-like [Sinocyclocheilus grahami]|uniref:semaphorin-3F-like n=1 Tax=Sinocyclocheilus grahami TaxID=75366 RepID=UPI0007AD406B|nr:PREDICTED: semaphorin-3F-like [Sinocyclocheilus grahami]